MQIKGLYSHLNGHEWMLVHQKPIWDELTALIEAVDADQLKTKISEEAGMRGRALYSPTDMNKAFKFQFESRHWAESRTHYWVTDDPELSRRTVEMDPDDQKAAIEAAGRTPILSYNQTDFLKERIAVEVQFGKYSFVAYDLFVKHVAFYVQGTIDLGIEILPMKELQAEMSSGPGYFEAALYDIVRQGRGVPNVPLVMLGIAP